TVRNIYMSFHLLWRNIALIVKVLFLTQVIASIFSQETISDEELEKMKTQDTINAMLNEFTEAFPKLKRPLIDERDQYLSQKIKNAPGEKIVAVLGAAHVPGITKEIKKEHNLKKLTQRPPKSKAPKIIGWSIPILILGIIAYTFLANPAAGWQQTVSWILWN